MRVSILVVLVVASLLGWACGQSAVQQAADANDVTVLNYALTLEHLESSFYDQGLAKFTHGDFKTAGFADPAYSNFQLIQAHESFHVAFLTAVLTAAHATPVPACTTYNFSAALKNVRSFVEYADTFENVGVTAYDGAINGISNPVYIQAGAEIATIEARHAAYLNDLLGVSPFPAPFDTANLPATIAAIVSPFLEVCDFTLQLPSVRPTGVTLNASGIELSGSIPPPSYSVAQQNNDLVALNYALTLEHLESAFYNTVTAGLSEAAFSKAGFPASYYNLSLMIAMHEATHVTALTTVINSRPGGAAVPACNYNFSSITDVTTFLATARLLENTGVMAYDGAANSITDTTLLQVAATIATVEARHASFLNLVNGGVPFPTNLDNGTAPAVIIADVVASGLVINCSYALVGPVVLPLFGSSVLGDPAFTGFNGQSFQVHGIPSRYFNLVSTPALQLSASFKMIEDGEAMTAPQMRQARLMQQIAGKPALPLTTAFSHSGTFLGDMGLQLSASSARLYVKAGPYVSGFDSVTVNGAALAVGPVPVQLESGAAVLRDTPSTLQVDTAEVSFTLVNSDGFINIQQATLNRAYTDDWQIDGLLGQTANPAWLPLNTRDFKSHMVLDYLIASSSDVFSNDFVANQFPSAAAE